MDLELIAAELPNHQQPLQELPFDVSLLRLDGGKSTAIGDDDGPSDTSCRCKCSCSSMKRPSPEPSTERHTKKPNYDSHSLCDFSVLPLPPISLPTLRRCGSGPYTAPRPSTSQTRDSLVAQSPPEDAKIVTDSPMLKGGSSSLPPKLPVPRRSIAAPTPSPDKTSSRSSGSNEIIREESIRIKRWQRMKDRLKEMTEWLEDMREGEEMKVTEDPTKDENEEEEGEEEEEEEAVWVERKGKCLVIHFKCPCGKGYQILLSGGMCYYKLM